MPKVTGKKVLSGLFWSFGERISAQAVTFIVTILLARILMPADYGVVSLILVFITLANVFVSHGFGISLVQKQGASDKDFSTIFWCSFLFSIFLYTGLFIAAPVIASFYNNELLTPIIRVLAIKLPISAIGTIQHAYVSKHMQFKKFFFSKLGGTIVSGIIGIIMAYMGFGPWAIVAQYLVNSIVGNIVLFFTISWKPTFQFDWKSAKELMGFGWKMMLSAFINSAYSEIRTLIVGKIYSAEDLGQFKRGNQFPQLFVTNVNTALGSVIFPAMSLVNNDVSEVRRLARRSMIMTSYLMFPLMVGLGVAAEPLVKFLLTDKWLPCVPFLQLACISYGIQPIQTANCQAIKAVGRSDVYLKMEIIKKMFGIGLLILFMKNGVMAVAVTSVVAVCFSAIISIIPNKWLINYNYYEQIKDLCPAVILSAIMGIFIYPIGKLSLPPFVVLVIQVILGMVLYLLLSVVTHNKSFIYLRSTLISMLGKVKTNG